MADEANKDEALRCLDIARAARQAGNIDKALKFAEKARALHACPEVELFLRTVQSGASSSQPRRRPAASPASSAAAGPSSGAGRSGGGAAAAGTPEQRAMVARIRAAKGDYYKVLNIERDATEDEVKRAYRKLALKLHPDKCQLPGAEEAFKEVSKAFTCLTDGQKRAFYDRTGHEDSASMASARSNGARGGGVHMHEVDPQELFNMMFGGGAFGMGPGFGMGPFGGFRTMNRAGPAPRRGPHGAAGGGGGGGGQARNPLSGSLPPVLQRAWQMVAGASMLQKIMMVSTLLRLLPLVIGLASWALYLLIFALPLHFVCAELAAFRTRRVYALPRQCQPLCEAVDAVLPYAQAYLQYSVPVVDAAKEIGSRMLQHVAQA